MLECIKTELFNSVGVLDNCQAYKCQIRYLYFTGNKYEEPFILSYLKRILLCLDMLTWVPFEMNPGRQAYLLKQQNIFFVDWHERKVKAFRLETEQMSSDEQFSRTGNEAAAFSPSSASTFVCLSIFKSIWRHPQCQRLHTYIYVYSQNYRLNHLICTIRQLAYTGAQQNMITPLRNVVKA